jgi:predicted Zn-dependent protease
MRPSRILATATRLSTWVAVTGVLAMSCGPKGDSTTPPDVPVTADAGSGLPDQTADIQMPEIPAEVAKVHVDPQSAHDVSAKSPLLDIMAAENKRWFDALKNKGDDTAHYIAYQIQDIRQVIIDAEGGALLSEQDESDRYLDTEVRVGTPQLDNTRTLTDPEQNAINRPMIRLGVVPMGTDELAITNALWLDTDRRYRESKLAYAQVKRDTQGLASAKTTPDFVASSSETYIQKQAKLNYDKEAWIKRVKSCSDRASTGVATRGSCSVNFEETTIFFVNSEGSTIQLSWTTAQLSVSVGVKAEDGMQLRRGEQRFARTPDGLPTDAEIDEMIKIVTSDLNALHEAPVVDPYVGPAILEGRAAGVFFHEVFGHRMEGHRQTEDTSGKTFTSQVDKIIMPEWLSVYDDPTVSSINGMQLNGFYHYDDEGVRAQKASLVENGVLKGFIQGRNPIDGFPSSNGHGRKQSGLPSVSRQGNLVVESTHSIPKTELEEQLIAEIKRQGKPFGMIFTDISGGFTLTSVFTPQAFKVNPVLAYRLYPDGRRELVRGVDIVGTPLTALANIMAASREVETFNGVCGAESGWVPVSASAPSLLIKSLEIERGFAGFDRPPVLDPPSVTTGGAK